MSLRQDAKRITEAALTACQPDEAVERALANIEPAGGRLILIALGKAAWSMAAAAVTVLGEQVDQGLVITKYDHAQGTIPKVVVREAGHPVPDENSYKATQEAEALVRDLSPDDVVLLLISGGGSALFEDPVIPGNELQDITSQLLASGADIVETNIIRKRLSRVKGGRFAEQCSPARVECIILSDIIGDPLDMIASGPAVPDSATRDDAFNVARHYDLNLSTEAWAALEVETPKELDNVNTQITGSVRELCVAASNEAEQMGYEVVYLTDRLDCEARDAGRFLGAIARTHADDGKKLCYVAGGETVVHLTGSGKGGRNQEIALAAAAVIAGLDNVVVVSVGSDGTDGPTDAAGGITDGSSQARLKEAGQDIAAVLQENDSYHALEVIDGLIITGPTGTNVNDLQFVLIG